MLLFFRNSFKAIFFVLLTVPVFAQNVGDTLITIQSSLKLAEERYHLLLAGNLELKAAYKNIEIAKYNKVPTLDFGYQAGVGTANNLTGMFYPGNVLPITGPPSQSNNYNAATGTAASLLLNWQVMSFGQKDAQINLALAEANSKNASNNQLLLRHKINVLNAYLDLLLAYDITSIQKRNIERNQVNYRESQVLVNSGIKPGVDTALFLSELSNARIGWMNALRQQKIYQLQLGQLVVLKDLPVPIDSSFLNYLPAAAAPGDYTYSNTPQLLYSKSQIDISVSKEALLKKSWYPKVNLWATGFARGSGFHPDGTIKTWEGLGLSKYNYDAGLQLVFPLLKYGEVKKQIEQQHFISGAATATLEENRLQLLTQDRIAQSSFESSVAIANETQQQLKSAQYAFNAMQIRYNTGLVNFSDLIQTQYNLLKAELEVKKSYWEVWKALLLQAAVRGDETIFLKSIH